MTRDGKPADPLGNVRLLDAGELAKALHISRRTVWRYTAEAEAGRYDFPLPLNISSKVRRWRLIDVTKWLSRLEQGGL